MTEPKNQSVTRHLKGEGCTNRAVTHLSYKWTIQNFSLYERDEVIESPYFPTNINEHQWFIRLSPKWDVGVGCIYSVDLLCKPAKLAAPAPSRVKFKCYVVNCEGKKEYKMSNTDLFGTSESLSINHPNFTRKTLLERKDQLLPNGALTIQFDIHVIGPISNITTGFSNFDIDSSNGAGLSEDFKNLLNNQEYCDVTIIVGDKPFKAHKPILAARSSVFSAMFKHGMKESEKNEVVITDVESEVFEKMLLFIYADEVPKERDGIEKCMNLLVAAEKYALDKLKTWCEKAICAKITIKNATEMLQFADLHQAKQLSEHVQDFFCRHSKEIMDTPEFKLLEDSNPRLIFPLMRKMSSLVSSNLGSNGPAAKRQKKT